MIDLEMNKGIYSFTRGIEISDETINIDLINKIGFGESENYLSSNQTLEYFKDILWDTELLDTTYRKNEIYKTDDMDRELLDRADKKWKKLLLSHKDIKISPKYEKEIINVIEAARKDLL